MNLIDLYNSEVQVGQKLDELEDFINHLATIAILDEPRPSPRMRLARLLIACGLTLDPDAYNRANVIAVGGATVATD
jgi:hypothetical protein